MMKSVLSLFLTACSLMLATTSAETLRALGGRTTCPSTNPLDDSNMNCRNKEVGLTCGYGSESCCGETFDSIQCECASDGQWACLATDRCMWPICERSCPEKQPVAGSSCEALDTLTCGYGKASCCGVTYNSIECQQCMDGTWACLASLCSATCEELIEVPLVEEVFP